MNRDRQAKRKQLLSEAICLDIFLGGFIFFFTIK